MRCDDVRGLFSEIYDDVADEQAALLSHIENCPECKAEYESYSKLFDELKELPEPELPIGFHDSIMEKIQALVPPTDRTIDELLENIETRNRIRKNGINKKGRQVTRRWAGVAAAACLLLASLWAMRTFDWPGMRSDEAFDMAYSLPQPVMDAAAFEAELADEYEFVLPGEGRSYLVPSEAEPESAPESEDTNWEIDNVMEEDATPWDMDDNDDYAFAEVMPQQAPLFEEDVDFSSRVFYNDFEDTEGEYFGIGAASGEIGITSLEDNDFASIAYIYEDPRTISPLAIVGISALCTAALGLIAWMIINRIKKGEATCPKTESH